MKWICGRSTNNEHLVYGNSNAHRTHLFSLLKQTINICNNWASCGRERPSNEIMLTCNRCCCWLGWLVSVQTEIEWCSHWSMTLNSAIFSLVSMRCDFWATIKLLKRKTRDEWQSSQKSEWISFVLCFSANAIVWSWSTIINIIFTPSSPFTNNDVRSKMPFRFRCGFLYCPTFSDSVCVSDLRLHWKWNARCESYYYCVQLMCLASTSVSKTLHRFASKVKFMGCINLNGRYVTQTPSEKISKFLCSFPTAFSKQAYDRLNSYSFIETYCLQNATWFCHSSSCVLAHSRMYLIASFDVVAEHPYSQ